MRVGYQDDTYLVGAVAAILEHFPDLCRSLARGGHRLRMTKCSVWVPACDELSDEELPAPVKELAGLIPLVRRGIRLLGGAVRGEMAVEVGPDDFGLGPARARADRAVALAGRIRDMVVAAPTPNAVNLAWHLASKCVAHALSYDARLVPSGDLRVLARPVSDALHDLVDAILSVEVEAPARRRLALTGAYGGCGMRQEALGAYADASLYAAYYTKVDRVHILSAALGRPVPSCRGGDEAELARAGLLESGVMVDDTGGVRLAADAAAMYVASPWHGDQPADEVGRLTAEPAQAPGPQAQAVEMAPPRVARRYASRIFRHLDAVAAAQLWHAADGPHREVMLASGGRGAGALWLAMPDRASDLFGASHFRMATLLRLNAFRPPRAAACQLAGRGDHEGGDAEGRQCGRMMGARGAHALLCKLGPARMRPHRQLAAVLARELRDVGAEVDLERVVPELAQRVVSGAPAVPAPAGADGGGAVASGAHGAQGCPDAGRGAAPGGSSGPGGAQGSPWADGRPREGADGAGAGTGGTRADSCVDPLPGAGARGVQCPGDVPDAIMDLVVAFPGSLAQVWVDVSIRCPHAERYTRADRAAGAAADRAAEEKRERYGPLVMPLVFESYGRLGSAGRRTLEVLALHAAVCVRDQWAVQRLVPRWHAALERAVTFATAEIALLALGARVQSIFGGPGGDG